MSYSTGASRVLAFFAITLLLASCGDPDPIIEDDVTGVELEITFDVDLDRLQIDGSIPGEPPFETITLPDEARELDGAGETVVLVVDDAFGGQTLELEISGLHSGRAAAEGVVSVELVTREIVTASLHLDCVGDACGVCDATTCSDGCCDNGRCVEETSAESCGSNGESCVTCDPDTTDRCSADGECACGTGEPCSAGSRCESGLCVCDRASCPSGCCDEEGACLLRTFEHCGIEGSTCTPCDPDLTNSCTSDGLCLCGNDPPCEDGQVCIGGICICDEESCAGCCDGYDCYQDPSFEHCGIGGSDCVACDDTHSDNCNESGVCACGENPPAGPTQECIGGERVCNPDACDGCCSDSETCEPSSFATCGSAGADCVACPRDSADRCLDGVCRCGSGDLCVDGQRCDGGLCVCDELSCPDGCCDGDVCLDGTSPDACGSGGNACVDCPDGDTCDDGVCSSCNATNCSDGCCLGATCIRPATTEACGVGGGACRVCGVTADTCSVDGTCRCGDAPACDDGQRCAAGVCICDELSCSDGCCDGTTCVAPLSLAQCAAPGEACTACDTDLADNCSASGSCRCGTGPSCQPGQFCDGGTCVCNATSCPDGCCAGNTCESPSLATCGVSGSLCTSCNATRSDTCDETGACVCGDGDACAIGQRCLAGACVCDSVSCTGCCDGTTCRSGTTDEACGLGGIACEPCEEGVPCEAGACSSCNATTCPSGCCSGSDCIAPPTFETCGAEGAACTSCSPTRADACLGGECRCGESAPCGVGTECVGGECVCSSDSCPSSCCADDVCQPRSLANCGTDGDECVTCDELLADTCSADGVCRCGASPQCEAGQRCVAGTCICDATSCTGCCADATCKPGDTQQHCGADGEACESCHPVFGRCEDHICYRD